MNDNPLQHARAHEIARLMAERSTVLRQPLDLGRGATLPARPRSSRAAAAAN